MTRPSSAPLASVRRLAPSRGEAGFTMIEVMVSVLLTAIAVIGFIAMYMTETRAGTFSRHSTEAAVLATDKLEQLRTMAIATTGEDTVDPLGNAGGMFTRRWTVTAVDSYSDLSIAVGWDEDEVTETCSADTDCTRSGFCMSSGNCAGRAVIVYGRRN